MKIFIIQELAGLNNILSNLFIDRSKTLISGCYDPETGERYKWMYLKYFDNPTYYNKFPAPTLYASFNKGDYEEFHIGKGFPQNETDKSIEECEYIICRATAGGLSEICKKGQETPLGNTYPMIRISNIFSTPKSWYRYIDLWVGFDDSVSIKDRFESVKNQVFKKPSLITMGYDDIIWIDIDDFFIENQIPKLINYIQKEYDIHIDDFTYWMLDHLNEHLLPRYNNIEISDEIIERTEDFNKLFSDYKIINTKTI